MDGFQINPTTTLAKILWTNILYCVDGDRENKAEAKPEGQDNLSK